VLQAHKDETRKAFLGFKNEEVVNGSLRKESTRANPQDLTFKCKSSRAALNLDAFKTQGEHFY